MSGLPFAPGIPLRARLRVPLYRNGYALVASSAVTSVLGLVFWLVAARQYSAASVGVSAALISAMTLLADLSHLNLKGALNRFLPTAGAESARFARRSYLVALGVAAVAATVFIAGLAVWSPELAFVRDRPLLALWFVAGTMAWTVFVLQDSVLAGIRQAGWVPAENLVFSLLKLGLLAVLATAAPVLGVFVSWSVAALVVVVPMNVVLFRRLVPRHVRATEGRTEAISARGVAGYVAMDYVAYAIWSATIGVLPLVVLHVAGAEASAYFYVSWSIAYSLYLASSGMGQSLLAEASLDPVRLAEHARATALETARLVVPAVLVVVLAAPLLLGLLGKDYSDEAVTLLRLLALSAIPFIVVATHVNVLRVRRRMRAVVATYGALCAVVLVVGIPLLAVMGIAGLGIGWLAGQTVVAGALLLRRLEGESLLRRVAALRRRALRRWRLVGSRRELETILRELAAAPDAPHADTILGHAGGLNDVLVSFAGPAGSAPTVVIKRACTPAGDAGLVRHARALAALRRRGEPGRYSSVAPRLVATGTVHGRRFVAERAMVGRPAAEALRDGMSQEHLLRVVDAGLEATRASRRRTATVDEAMLREWVDLPAERLRRAAARHSGLRGHDAAVDALVAELRGALEGTQVTTGWMHGDLCPDNVLISASGEHVMGVVDWEQARRDGLPAVDRAHLLATTRMITEGSELGPVVAGLLPETGDRTSLLLAWLGHVSGNLAKSERYGRSRAWVRRNVDPVLGTLVARPATEATGARLAAESVRAAAGRALPFAPIALALVAWALALGAVDVRAMTDLGLVSVLPPLFVAALLLLISSFVVTACRRPDRTALLVTHVLALIGLIHATPSILYGTLRYSWAWKHVGIVDYIERRGAVATDADFLTVYHNWPGFFGVDALLGGVGNVGDMVAVASWGPVFFNVLNLAALVFLFSTLTKDRRVIWAAVGLYFVTSWVGQDYFSPQAFAFFLYVVMLGVVLRWLGSRAGVAAGRRTGPVVLVALLMTAIAASHALTSVMAVLALTALTLAGVCAVRWLPVMAAGITAAWDLLFATDYVAENMRSTIESITLPWAATKADTGVVGELSSNQELVGTLGRGLSALIVGLAIAGAVRAHRSGRLDRAVVVLAAAPFVLLASGSYGGEILFRIYLFALPFLVLLAAQGLVGPAVAWRRTALATGAAMVACLSLFLFAYYGKDRQYYFTPAEVAAAQWVYTHAPAGTLLIEGTRNYPIQFKNYERFEYVTMSREPESSHARFVREPEAVFSDWMSDPSHAASFVIITRSQKAEVAELGAMPPGSLDVIERKLLASPRFRTVFRNRDATVFALAGDGLEATPR